jgi:hypothetical protein
LRTETLACHSAGSEYTRFDKTRIVVQHALSYSTLDICASQSPSATINCSACWKCLRAQFSLELLGSLASYSKVFQLERYARVRTLFIASLLQSREAVRKEIREQIEQQQFAVPRAAKVLSTLAPPVLLRALLDAYATACSRKDAERFDLPSGQRAPTPRTSDRAGLRAAIN